MAEEILKIFDVQQNHIGVASREDVHTIGHWHETFHCWFVSHEAGHDTIYLQIRSGTKDFPHLLDVTASGHLLADEMIDDGTREIKEELGLDVTFDELVPLGTFVDRIQSEDFTDNEFTHVFLYLCPDGLQQYELQQEEVSGLVKADFHRFYGMWLGEMEEIEVEGFKISQTGRKAAFKKAVSKNSFVPHEATYYENVVKQIKKALISSG